MFFRSKKMRTGRGSSTVEYLLLVTAVLTVLIAFLRPSGIFAGRIGDAHNTMTNDIKEAGANITNGFTNLLE